MPLRSIALLIFCALAWSAPSAQARMVSISDQAGARLAKQIPAPHLQGGGKADGSSIPQVFRWLSEDPIGEAGGMNLYGYVDNGPTGAVDSLGLWSPEAHDALLSYAFAGALSPSDLSILQAASRHLDDTSQGTSEACKHAMCSPSQTPEQARQARYDYVQSQLSLAKSLAASGNRGAALAALGYAMHTVMDYSSPAHTTASGQPIVWDGIYTEIGQSLASGCWWFPHAGHSPGPGAFPFSGSVGNEKKSDITPKIYDQNLDRLRSLYNTVFGKGALQ